MSRPHSEFALGEFASLEFARESVAYPKEVSFSAAALSTFTPLALIFSSANISSAGNGEFVAPNIPIVLSKVTVEGEATLALKATQVILSSTEMPGYSFLNYSQHPVIGFGFTFKGKAVETIRATLGLGFKLSSSSFFNTSSGARASLVVESTSTNETEFGGLGVPNTTLSSINSAALELKGAAVNNLTLGIASHAMSHWIRGREVQPFILPAEYIVLRPDELRDAERS